MALFLTVRRQAENFPQCGECNMLRHCRGRGRRGGWARRLSPKVSDIILKLFFSVLIYVLNLFLMASACLNFSLKLENG
jgi:hypothetical protein